MVLSPVVQIPVELEKLFVVIEHALPDREQLRAIATELTSEQPSDLPTGEGLQRVLDAATTVRDCAGATASDNLVRATVATADSAITGQNVQACPTAVPSTTGGRTTWRQLQ